MQAEALAFGQEMAVPQADLRPWDYWHLTGDAGWWMLYDAPDGKPVKAVDGIVVLGRIGDEWYHVWEPDTGYSGYIQQDDLLAHAWRGDALANYSY